MIFSISTGEFTGFFPSTVGPPLKKNLGPWHGRAMADLLQVEGVLGPGNGGRVHLWRWVMHEVRNGRKRATNAALNYGLRPQGIFSRLLNLLRYTGGSGNSKIDLGYFQPKPWGKWSILIPKIQQKKGFQMSSLVVTRVEHPRTRKWLVPRIYKPWSSAIWYGTYYHHGNLNTYKSYGWSSK